MREYPTPLKFDNRGKQPILFLKKTFCKNKGKTKNKGKAKAGMFAQQIISPT